MRRVVVVCTLAAVLGGCGSEPPALPAGCGAKPADVMRALQRAPAAVTLPDGTPISRCVRDANSTAELETVGVSLQTAAARLREDAASGAEGIGFGEDAAVALGYLAGAARKGADASPGISEELAVRIGRVAGRLIDAAPEHGPAVERGLRAGKRLG
jgi:hypothetical protein